MQAPAPDPYPPRSLALLDAAMTRLGLRALPPFGASLALGLFATVGGLLLPRYLGGLAGSLLAMQFLVVMFMAFLLGMIFVRRIALSAPDRDKALHGARLAAWIIDFEVAAFFITALAIGGLFGPLEFLALVGATFLGGMRGQHGALELADIGARCVVALSALLVVRLLCGLPADVGEWPGDHRSVIAAGLYFGALGVLELTPVYPSLAALALRGAEIARRPQVPPS